MPTLCVPAARHLLGIGIKESKELHCFSLKCWYCNIVYTYSKTYNAIVFALFGSFCGGKKNNIIFMFFYLWWRCPHAPTSFGGPKKQKDCIKKTSF
ncbi:hypothetical protein E6A48_01150 [Brachyspira pilosicoli]|nr:hypothetical protein [Brachyspira pilosicoli]